VLSLSVAENSRQKGRNIISQIKTDKCTFLIQICSKWRGKGNIGLYFWKSLTAKKKTDFQHQINTKNQQMGGEALNGYFTAAEAGSYVFYKVPKALFTDKRYGQVSTDAKMLYGLLLDRMYLSTKNGWIDKYGRVYQYFTIKQAQELLHFGHEKICKLFRELECADLISRKRQGQGKANIIYLKKFL